MDRRWKPLRQVVPVCMIATIAVLGSMGWPSITAAAFDRFEVEPFVVGSNVQSAWVNGQGLADAGVPSNYSLVLTKPLSALRGEFAGAAISNVAGLTSIADLGFDLFVDPFGSRCLAEPRMRVDTTAGLSFAFPCRSGTQTQAPGGGGNWRRVRFHVPDIPPGDAVARIIIEFGRTESGRVTAQLDNIDVNGTLIGRPLPRIVFHSERNGNLEIYMMYDDGANQSRLTANASLDGLPALSPDRRRICFQSDRDGNQEIYTMNADGSAQTRITNSPGDDGSCNWSPDGRRIVFTSNRDGDYEIYVMNADGTNSTRLTFSPGVDSEPAFTPDGLRIVFTSARNGAADVYVMNVDGSNQTRLTTNPADDSHPSFSPDGNRIAFVSIRDGNFEIYVMNADGTNEVRLTNNSALDHGPNFMPDGRIVFHTDRDGGNVDIYVMNGDGTNPNRLTSDPARDFSASAR